MRPNLQQKFANLQLQHSNSMYENDLFGTYIMYIKKIDFFKVNKNVYLLICLLGIQLFIHKCVPKAFFEFKENKQIFLFIFFTKLCFHFFLHKNLSNVSCNLVQTSLIQACLYLQCMQYNFLKGLLNELLRSLTIIQKS